MCSSDLDGTGGPDSAPDNLRGHTDNSGDLVFIDNWAILDLDRNNDTGLNGGRPGPDGVADWDVSPKSRITFRFQPPVVALRFAADQVQVDRPAFSPDRGEQVNFSVVLDKKLSPDDPIAKVRQYNLTANVYDMRGRFIRAIYQGQTRNAVRGQAGDSFWNAATNTDTRDLWDGRDERGRIVPPGVYVIRTVIEPNLSRALRSVVVVR